MENVSYLVEDNLMMVEEELEYALGFYPKNKIKSALVVSSIKPP